MKYKTVVFDLDGTLIDTLGDLTASVNAVLARFSFTELSRDAVRLRIGDGLRKLMERCLPDGTDNSTIEEAMAYFKGYYAEHLLDFAKPYAGMAELVKKLKSCSARVAVATNKDEPLAQLLIEHFFGNSFDAVCGMTASRTPKPAPDIPKAAIANGTKVLFIGDSETDYNTAKANGYAFLGVKWGYGKTLADDAVWAQDAKELEKLIFENEKL